MNKIIIIVLPFSNWNMSSKHENIMTSFWIPGFCCGTATSARIRTTSRSAWTRKTGRSFSIGQRSPVVRGSSSPFREDPSSSFASWALTTPPMRCSTASTSNVRQSAILGTTIRAKRNRVAIVDHRPRILLHRGRRAVTIRPSTRPSILSMQTEQNRKELKTPEEPAS